MKITVQTFINTSLRDILNIKWQIKFWKEKLWEISGQANTKQEFSIRRWG